MRGLPRSGALAAVLVFAVFAQTGCTNERDRTGRAESCTSWLPDVAPLLADKCVSCHGGDDPAAGYDLSSYLGALGDGTDDVPDAIAQDLQSVILTTLTSPDATEPHASLAAEVAPVLTAWIQCDVSARRSLVHQHGILDRSSPDFHGKLLRSMKYDFDFCRRCHGEDFGGGGAGVACTSCHVNGPTACTTCHSELPEQGAHGVHLGGVLDTSKCSTCHKTPSVYTDVGHIFLADGSLDPPPVEVSIGGLGAETPFPDRRAGPPSFDHDTQQCQNVYCHGDVFGDTEATNSKPIWTGGSAQVECGSCHGRPPADHHDDRCGTCHSAVIARDGTFVDPSLHVNGVIDYPTVCNGCHGGAKPSPPPDLNGDTSTSLVTVGAHASHVTGMHRLRGPIPCSDCHLEPTAVLDVGHIDTASPAEVFPGPSFAGLAAADSASPVWDRTAATCSGTYCHGGGAKLANDSAAGLMRTPMWTDVGDDQAACGNCHGIPPVNGIHQATWTVFDCNGCHPSVNAFGNPIITGSPGQETSLHINGVVDVR